MSWTLAVYLVFCGLYGALIDFQGRMFGWKYFFYLMSPGIAYVLGHFA